MEVHFNDLRSQYNAIQTEIDAAIRNAVQDFNFIRSETVTLFEKSFSSTIQASHCIATANGTDSLFLCLKALNIKPGDEVITPAFSWISSAEVVSLCGAKPVFVDVHPANFTIDPQKISGAITPRTKAVIVVHLYGNMAAIEEIRSICDKKNIEVIEDCAQAHGSELNGRAAGTFGTLSAFSFYPTKNLGAYGDAGCVVTNDDALASRVRRLANHGALQKDDHDVEGINSRMDTIQAAILSVKLKYLRHWNGMRQHNAALYTSQLNSIDGLVVPTVAQRVNHTFHLYVVRTARRNELQQYLKSRGIQTIIHYPEALHNVNAYRYLGHQRSDYPVSTLLSEQVLSLPVYPELTHEQIAYVCENIKEFFQK